MIRLARARMIRAAMYVVFGVCGVGVGLYCALWWLSGEITGRGAMNLGIVAAGAVTGGTWLLWVSIRKFRRYRDMLGMLTGRDSRQSGR